MTTDLHKNHPRGLPLPHEYARHVERFTPKPAPVPRWRWALVILGPLVALAWLWWAFYL